MKQPKFTDAVKFTRPYVCAADTAKPNYLKDRFDKIIKAQKEAAEREAAKPSATVRALKTAKAKDR